LSHAGSRDYGERGKAIQAYLQRAELGFSTEEVFVSLCARRSSMRASLRLFDDEDAEPKKHWTEAMQTS
jgi:hypothetical protein